MKLKFLGASGTVTGSRYLLSDGDEKILVDCGLFQGLKELRLKNWEAFPVNPAELSAVVLSHAHLDHSGYLPLLIRNGFRGSIFATPATRELCRILLLDSGHLQEEEAKFANRHGYSKHSPALPLYTKADAERAMGQFVDVQFREKKSVSANFVVEFFTAGHLLGAASVLIGHPHGRVLFSGDLGREQDPVMPPPEGPPIADVLVIESTYGNRSHVAVDAEAEIAEIINRTIQKRGTVLIPSFAVGRAQLLLYFIHKLKAEKRIPNIPVYLNSPMASAVNNVFRKYAGQHRLDPELTREVCGAAIVVTSPEESKSLNQNSSPKIVIAASGMATGGRVLHHLKTLLGDPRNAIVFAGFQAAGTRGEALVRGAREVKIHGAYWPVRAAVRNIEALSAHADADELLRWMRKTSFALGRVYVTHGEPASSAALANRIRVEAGVPASVPQLLDEVDIQFSHAETARSRATNLQQVSFALRRVRD